MEVHTITTTALADLRILECGDFVAAPYAAALLGHLGADVIKVEPPDGDSNRRRGPFPGGTPQRETGGLHLFLDQAKRGVVLDLDTAAGCVGLRRLAAQADIVIAGGAPGLLERRGLTYAALREINPELVVTAITPFGLDAAEDRDLPVREICDLAAGGWLALSPGALEDPALPPLKPFGQQAHFQAGVHAAIATLGAVAARDAGAGGQQVDVSTQAVIASQIENAIAHWTYSGRVASRLGLRLLGPWGILRLRDGLLFLVCVQEEEWQRLVGFIGHPEWVDSPLFADRLLRGENNDALLAVLQDALADSTVQETYHTLQAQRVPCSGVNSMADLLTIEHLQARASFVEGIHPVAGKWTFPGAPWKLSATPWQPGRPAPLLGEHQGLVDSAQWTGGSGESAVGGGGSRRPAGAARQASSRPSSLFPLPLAGVRVADFSWVIAGPVAAMTLAHLGADVIKIESATRLDTGRSAIPPFWHENRTPNSGGFFNQYSQGKRSLLLNAKHPEGLNLARALISRADVVIDNFGAGVMQRLGLGYAALRTIKPDIVQISLSGHGQTGPIANYVAYGPVQAPMIGLTGLTGFPGGGPREVGISYIDFNAGMHAAFAVLAALHHRRRTGEGQYIDMSQWEAALPLITEGLLTYQMTGEQPPRMGSRDQFEAPQNVFRCAGDDRWVAISCWSDVEWRALAGVIDRPELRDDAGLATAAGRKAREEELEAAIATWTAQHTPETAARALREAGVPAQAALGADEVVSDPRLAARGFWVELPHPECTGARHAGIPWQFSRTPLSVRRAAPALGQHTDEVLREVLGKSDAEIARLYTSGALQ